MHSSLRETEKFFESAVWMDIREWLTTDLNVGLNELADPSVSEIGDINYTRGGVKVIREVLGLREKLMEIREIENEGEEEEVNEDG